MTEPSEHEPLHADLSHELLQRSVDRLAALFLQNADSVATLQMSMSERIGGLESQLHALADLVGDLADVHSFASIAGKAIQNLRERITSLEAAAPPGPVAHPPSYQRLMDAVYEVHVKHNPSADALDELHAAYDAAGGKR